MKVPAVKRLICTVFFLVLLPVPGHALTPAQVFEKVKRSVVVVKTLDAQGKVKGQGSGVLLSSGRVATNCHVVEGGASYQVGRGKKLLPATLYAEDSDKDICLLDAKGIQGEPAQLGKAAGLKVGDPVYAVGAPKGLELSLSDGVVAQLRVVKNDSEGGWDSERLPLIQTTAAISPGSSGGGLFDRQGRLVGLTTFYIEGGQSLNFAMPAEWIGEVKRGRKADKAADTNRTSDIVLLVCSVAGEQGGVRTDESYRLDYTNETVDGHPAIFTDAEVNWKVTYGKGEEYFFTLNRYSGWIVICDKSCSIPTSGQCSVAAERKF